MESPVVWGWSRASGPESIRKLAKCSRSSGRRTIFYTGTIMNNQHKNSQNTTKTKHNMRRVLRVAVHRGVDDEHALGLRGIAAPCVVLFNEPAQILAPHGAVERADVLDLIQNAAGLFQQELDMGAVLAHDIGEVAAGVIQPVSLEIHLVGEQLAVQRAEGAEGVGGKEAAVGDVEGHHGLRPVNHRRAHKGVLKNPLPFTFWFKTIASDSDTTMVSGTVPTQ